MIATLSLAYGTIIAALITSIPASIALWNRRSLNQINRAVNHVNPGEPTLIERVKRIESNTETFNQWVVTALVAVAEQVGTKLPDRPN